MDTFARKVMVHPLFKRDAIADPNRDLDPERSGYSGAMKLSRPRIEVTARPTNLVDCPEGRIAQNVDPAFVISSLMLWGKTADAATRHRPQITCSNLRN